MASLVAAFTLVTCSAWAAETAWGIRGIVRDEAGKPLAAVKVQLCGREHLEDGIWTRPPLTTGLWPSYATDKEGRFAIPSVGPDSALDLYFDKEGYAPVILYRVRGSTNALSVVMKRGLALVGHVQRRVGEKLEAVSGATVELCLPHDDLWYQQRTRTDPEGRYVFQVTPPPDGKKWQVVYGDERVQVEIEEGKPVAGPDFEAPVKELGDAKKRVKEGAER
jgi:hypothetical protein